MMNFANPTVFLALTRRVLPWLAAATAALFAVGLWLSFAAPPDYQQGETVKIMYLHVPAAWLSTFIYGVMTAGGARHAGLAPSAGRRRAEGGGAARRGLHLHLPRHRLAVGQADVGDLLGVGRAPDLGAGAVHPLSRAHRALAHDRGSGPRGARGGDPDAGRLPSTCRSSNSRSTGGTRCTSRPRCSGSAARPSRPSCCGRCWSCRSPSPACS